MKEIIVLNKEVVSREIDSCGFPQHKNYLFKGIPIIGKKNFIEILMFEAQQRALEKAPQIVKELLEKYEFKKLEKNELKEVFKYVKFLPE